MLQHLGLHKTKLRIESALIQTLKDGIKTGDLGGKSNTKEFTKAIISNLEPVLEDEFKDPVPLRIKSGMLKTYKEVEEYCHGVDVFVENPKGLPTMPEQVDNLKLKMISNRGTKVYPGVMPKIWLVDHHRCRYVATDANGNYMNIGDEEIFDLIREISAAGIKWMHIEKLQLFDGELGYSKAQGE